MLADEAARAKRLVICAACPERKQLPLVKTQVCGRCGCPIGNKVKFTRATCPLNKW